MPNPFVVNLPRLQRTEGAVAGKRLAGKVALVTGGSRGIGAAIAARIAGDGAKVVVNYLQSEAGAARVVAAIEAAGGNAIALRGDVSRVESASTLVSETVKRFGSLDVLVNNAAINKKAPSGAVRCVRSCQGRRDRCGRRISRHA